MCWELEESQEMKTWKAALRRGGGDDFTKIEHITLCQAHSYPTARDVGTTVTRKSVVREVKAFIEGHSAKKWQDRGSQWLPDFRSE